MIIIEKIIKNFTKKFTKFNIFIIYNNNSDYLRALLILKFNYT